MASTVTTSAAGADSLARHGDMQSRLSTAKRAKRRSALVPVLIVLAVVAAATTWSLWGWDGTPGDALADRFTITPRSFKMSLREKGELKASKSADIKSEVEGRATIISLIEEGKAVQKGDLLVELASDQIEDRIRQEELKESNASTAYEAAKTELDIQRDQNASDIRKAELEIELKQLEYDKYVKGEWEQKRKDADIEIEQAENQLDNAKEDFDAAEKLYERNFITRAEYKQDEFNFKKAQWDLVKANMAKEVLKTYTHVAELRKRQSDLEEAKKECERVKKNAEAEETKKLRNVEGKKKELELIQDQLANLRKQKENCRIFAPTKGFVVYYSESWRWGSGDQVKEGAEVHERQILMQLPDTSEMVVAVRIHESKTDKLSLEQPALVEVEGIPGKQFPGKVTKIAVVADSQNRWLNPDLKEYETEITLDPTDAPLKPGATAHVEILVGRVEDALAVPVQSIFSKSGHKYVFLPNGKGSEYREVKIGAVSTEWAEVKEGVQKGESILLAFSDEQTRVIPEPERPAGLPFPGGEKPSLHGADGQPSNVTPRRPDGRSGPRGGGRRGR